MIKDFLKSLGERGALFNRKPIDVKGDRISESVNHLNQRGFVVLDHLVGSSEFASLKRQLDKKIEHDFDLIFPCLAQKKIDTNRDQDLIAKKFLVTSDELASRKLTFCRKDVQSYEQMIAEFQPSTLTVPMPSEISFYNVWLDPDVTAIVSNYMGFYPELTEAYLRRNFPCNYPVMNHNWHRDSNHTSHLLKAFIFFTDCDIDTGAHHYISGSVNDPRFRDKIYYTDKEINTAWPLESEEHMVSSVKAGTIIIEDTRGLHKAGIPRRAYRDLGFAVFLPPNIFNRNKTLYRVDKSVFDKLSEEQSLFIPSANIVAG